MRSEQTSLMILWFAALALLGALGVMLIHGAAMSTVLLIDVAVAGLSLAVLELGAVEALD